MNLSVEGIRLRTGTFSIPTGTLVDMEFSLGDHNWQISGLVVHQVREGVGIMFRVSQPELFELASELSQMPLPPETGPDYYQEHGGNW
jgi:hypothetical protein